MNEVVAVKLPKVEDVTGSLSGFDELAIEQKFGGDLGSLSGTMSLRALVFVLERRSGADDKTAYGAAMRKTLVECRDAFDHEDDEDDDEGEAAGGEG